MTNRKTLLFLLFVKVFSLALTYLAVSVWPRIDEVMFWRVMARWPREGGPVFQSHFATWDAAHYLRLSEVGYEADLDSCAFYPLWPISVRWGSGLTGGSHLLAGMVLANLFSLTAFVLFYHVVRDRFGGSIAKWALVLLIAFPGSLFYQFIYSEPLFFLLVMLLWLALERGRYDWAWPAALLLPLARPVGIVAVLPIAWYLSTRRPVPGLGWLARWGLPRMRMREAGPSDASWPLSPCLEQASQPFDGERECRSSVGLAFEASAKLGTVASESSGSEMSGTGDRAEADRQGGPPNAIPEAAWSNLRFYWLLAVPLAGWAVYFTFMWLTTGNPLEGIQAQRHWGVHSATNVINVPKFVIDLFTPTRWHGFNGSMLDRCFFVLMLYAIPVMWRLDKGLLVWVYMLGIFPAMSGGFVSFTRYAGTVFPMFIAFAVLFEPKGWNWGRWGIVAGFAMLHMVLLWRFVNFRWAG